MDMLLEASKNGVYSRQCRLLCAGHLYRGRTKAFKPACDESNGFPVIIIKLQLAKVLVAGDKGINLVLIVKCTTWYPSYRTNK